MDGLRSSLDLVDFDDEELTANPMLRFGTREELTPNPLIKFRSRQPHTGPSPPKQVLYRDALHGVFGFLPLKEVLLAGRVSNAWQAAVSSLSARGEKLTHVNEEILFHLFRSQARRHISRIAGSEPAAVVAGDSESDEPVASPVDHCWSPQSLLLVAAGMERITDLRCHVSLETRTLPFVFPRCLQRVCLSIRIHSGDAGRLEMVTSQLAATAPGLMRADFFLTQLDPSSPDTPRVAFSRASLLPLRSLSGLTSLSVPVRPDDLACVSVLRAMKPLRRLTLGYGWTLDALAHLVARQADVDALPSLEEVRPLNRLEGRVASHLVRLPSLTALAPGTVHLADPGVILPQLPKLASLRLHCTDTVDISLCMGALVRCGQLTELSLHHTDLSDAHLGFVLPQLRHLVALECARCPNLTSLQWIRSIATTLEYLSLLSCVGLTWVEVAHLRLLQRLRFLIVRDTFAGIEQYEIDALTPGHTSFRADQWPRLKKSVIQV